MSLLKDMARRGKDMAFSTAAGKLAEKYVSPLGRMLDVHLDSSGKSIEVTVLFHGENEPITIKANRYEMMQDSGRYFIRAHDITISRQWLDAVAKEYIQNRPFEIPELLARAIGFLA